MKKVLVASVLAISAGTVGSSQAALVTNGDFEASPDLTGWTVAGASITTAPAIDGKSALITGGNGITSQREVPGLTNFSISFDFAVFAAETEGNRTLSFIAYSSPVASETLLVNLRVARVGGAQVVQTYAGSWQTLAGLTPNITVDNGNDKLWIDETPAVNSMTIAFDLSGDKTAWTYAVTLNGDTVSNVQNFQGGATGNSVNLVRFLGVSSESDYIVDNVNTVVPEPASALMGSLLGAGLLLRRRKA